MGSSKTRVASARLCRRFSLKCSGTRVRPAVLRENIYNRPEHFLQDLPYASGIGLDCTCSVPEFARLTWLICLQASLPIAKLAALHRLIAWLAALVKTA